MQFTGMLNYQKMLIISMQKINLILFFILLCFSASGLAATMSYKVSGITGPALANAQAAVVATQHDLFGQQKDLNVIQINTL